MNGQSKDIAAIKNLAQEWNTGWDRSDTEALLSLYTNDPVLIPQGQPEVIGKDAIRSLYSSLFAEFAVKGNGRVVKVEASGNLGYFWSSYTLTATPKAGGDQIKGEGRSVFIVKRQEDNSWKIALLIDNCDRE